MPASLAEVGSTVALVAMALQALSDSDKLTIPAQAAKLSFNPEAALGRISLKPRQSNKEGMKVTASCLTSLHLTSLHKAN